MVIQRSVVTIDLYTMTNFITVRAWLSSLPFYHCRYWTKCPIPMLLLHTFSMMGDYVVDSNKIKTIMLGTQGSYQNSQGGLRENKEYWFVTEEGLYKILMKMKSCAYK